MTTSFLIGDFELDVVSNQDHSLEFDVTDLPMEKKVSITDHIRRKPRTLNIEGIVSDTPFGSLAERRGSLPSQDFRLYLEKLLATGEPVSVTTPIRFYERMAVVTFSETITKETGDAARFRMSFKEVNFVTTNRTTVRVASPRNHKKVDKGVKPSKDSASKNAQEPSGQTTQNVSALYQISHGRAPDNLFNLF